MEIIIVSILHKTFSLTSFIFHSRYFHSLSFDEINHKRIPDYTGELLCRKIPGQYLSPAFKLTASPRLVVKNPRSFWCISVFISSQLINSWLIRYVSFWIDSFQESPETLNVDFDAAVFMREIITSSDIWDSMVYFPSYWLCNIAGICLSWK